MYEDFFALRSRPFTASGDGDTFVSTAAIDDALRTTLDCVLAGNGPAIITGATGVGKTVFCLELARRASHRLHSVILGSTGFENRGELLQALLFEFGRQFTGLTEHEARLRVIEAARSRPPDREGVLLIVDEAHRLEPQLLDELWQLTTQRVDGRPVIRLVLCGQLELEERLASPELGALNQHLGSHVILEALTGSESRQLIADQLERAGTDISDVFADDAVELICRASDGNCRAINQLCDHSLLLAFVEEERPVTASRVQAALEDLRGLPLHWNETSVVGDDRLQENEEDHPSVVDGDAPVSTMIADELNVLYDDTDASESLSQHVEPGGGPDAAEFAVIEVGGSDCSVANTGRRDCHPELAPVARQMRKATDAEEEREFSIEDRYARLDQLAELGLTGDPERRVVTTDSMTVCSATEEQILSQVAELREEVRLVRLVEPARDSAPVNLIADDETLFPDGDEPVWDVIEPELDRPITAEVASTAEAPEEAQATIAEVLGQAVSTAVPAEPILHSTVGSAVDDRASAKVPSEVRRYSQLFTRLKRRRREASESLRETIPFFDR